MQSVFEDRYANHLVGIQRHLLQYLVALQVQRRRHTGRRHHGGKGSALTVRLLKAFQQRITGRENDPGHN